MDNMDDRTSFGTCNSSDVVLTISSGHDRSMTPLEPCPNPLDSPLLSSVKNELKRPTLSLHDLPPHLRNVGQPLFTEGRIVCPLVAPDDEQELRSEAADTLGRVRLMRFTHEIMEERAMANSTRNILTVHKECSIASKTTVSVYRRFAVLTAYSAVTEEGWIKVGYRGQWGWARAACFEQINHVRRYEMHAGANYFFCEGKCMLGPDLATLRWSNLLILLPTVLWMALVFPAFSHGEGAPWFVVIAVVAALAVGFLYATAFTDPGILVKREPHEELEVPEEVREAVESERKEQEATGGRDRRGETAMPKNWKYCSTCR